MLARILRLSHFETSSVFTLNSPFGGWWPMTVEVTIRTSFVKRPGFPFLFSTLVNLLKMLGHSVVAGGHRVM